MPYEDITVSVKSCACVECGATGTPPDGRCPGCGGERFDVIILKRSTGMDEEEIGEAGAVGLMKGAGTWKRETDIELKGVPGPDLARWCTLPLEPLLAAIQEYRKAEARRNLKKNQGVCPACGIVFTKAHSGPTTQGFCSAYCQKRAARGVAAKAAPAAAPSRTRAAEPARLGTMHRVGSRTWTTIGIALLVAIPVGKALLKYAFEDEGDPEEFSYQMGERRLEDAEREAVTKFLTAWLDELKAGRDGKGYWEKEPPAESLGPVASTRILGMAGIGKSGGVRAKVEVGRVDWTVLLVMTPAGWKVSMVTVGLRF